MEYKRLNLIDGADQDLKDFFRLIQLASNFDGRYVNIEVLSKLIASKVVDAFVAIDEYGEVVGLQLWEVGHLWWSKGLVCASRLQFLDEKYRVGNIQVEFLMYCVVQQRKDHDPERIMVMDVSGASTEYLNMCGLKTHSHVMEL